MASPVEVAEGELERLYRLHHAGLFRLALVLTGDPRLADDLTQEAFARLARQRAWPRTGAELAYLRRTVVNLSHSHFRRVALARRHPAERERSWDVTAEAGTARALQRRVAACVRTLPGRQRECVVLHYYLNLTDTQIAAVLGIAPGTVKSMLHRARAALARQLRDLR
jgi:RNA polymerase sigma-70 factor (ECF subfamily)